MRRMMWQACIVVALVFAAEAAQGQTDPFQLVPRGLMSATSTGPLEFAAALQHSNVRVGLVLREADSEFRRKPVIEWERDQLIGLRDVVDAFNLNNPAYTATIQDGIVTILPPRYPAYLDESFEPDELVVDGATRALLWVCSGLPGVDPTGGIISVRHVSPEEAGDYATVVFRLGGTVLNALHELAIQTNQSWLVVEGKADDDDHAILAVALLHRNAARSYVWRRRDTP